MGGLYIHIPFCKQACSYCNFHFSTKTDGLQAMVEAIVLELMMRSDYLEGTVESIYLGGGTPSLLSAKQLNTLFTAIHDTFDVAEGAEVTLEANPDDLTVVELKHLRDTPVNRLSIGIQSFHEADLLFMRRAHNSRQAMECIEHALEADFTNLTIDLIYGTPGLSNRSWESNLKMVGQFEIKHLSCYALTVEEKTLLADQIRKKKVAPLNDQLAEAHFEILVDYAMENGFEHYEISNFAKRGHMAVHNSNYWKQVPYLGLGPSAHSFNGISRSWNVANNARYLKEINEGQWPHTTEKLSQSDRHNEYVMTSLRTMWGCDLEQIARINAIDPADFQENVEVFVDRGWAISRKGIYYLTKEGKLFADRIASELFVI